MDTSSLNTRRAATNCGAQAPSVGRDSVPRTYVPASRRAAPSLSAVARRVPVRECVPAALAGPHPAAVVVAAGARGYPAMRAGAGAGAARRHPAVVVPAAAVARGGPAVVLPAAVVARADPAVLAFARGYPAVLVAVSAVARADPAVLSFAAPVVAGGCRRLAWVA